MFRGEHTIQKATPINVEFNSTEEDYIIIPAYNGSKRDYNKPKHYNREIAKREANDLVEEDIDYFLYGMEDLQEDEDIDLDK